MGAAASTMARPANAKATRSGLPLSSGFFPKSLSFLATPRLKKKEESDQHQNLRPSRKKDADKENDTGGMHLEGLVTKFTIVKVLAHCIRVHWCKYVISKVLAQDTLN